MKRIVVLGGGFAGVQCVRSLEREAGGEAEITLVSEDNFWLFTPMLPQVASGMIETRHAVMPIRAVARRSAFYEGRVKNIDPYGKIVNLWGSRERRGASIPYDFLVVALGSETNFFGMADIEKNAYRMKTLNDAVLLRNRVIDMLEQAENEVDPVLRSGLLTFVIVGGGFAGVETAGEIMDLLVDATKYYRNISPGDVRVVILEAMKGILPGFSPGLAEFARDKLVERGISLQLETAVAGFDGEEVVIKKDGAEESIQTRTLVWTAGVTPPNTIKRSLFKTEKGRIVVGENLGVEGFEGVFAIGDCALVMDPATGRPLPPTAQVAEAEAKTVSANLCALLRGGHQKKFEFHTKGQMAIIGKRSGIALFLGMNVHGILAWFLWRNVYIAKVPTWSKRFRIMIDWAIDAIFDRDIARLKVMQRVDEKEYRKLDEVDDVW